MRIKWEDLKELGVDWMEYCKETGTNEWCRNEGYDGEFDITPEQLKKLMVVNALLVDVQAMIDEVLPLLANEELWDDNGIIFDAHQILFNFRREHFG